MFKQDRIPFLVRILFFCHNFDILNDTCAVQHISKNKRICVNICSRCRLTKELFALMKIIYQESVLRSTETSMTVSGAVFTFKGKSTSTVGGEKYMCSDIMQTTIPKKSCKDARKCVTKYQY